MPSPSLLSIVQYENYARESPSKGLRLLLNFLKYSLKIFVKILKLIDSKSSALTCKNRNNNQTQITNKIRYDMAMIDSEERP
jgi:hypothetical protein